jgi:hypothetical protein
MLARMVAACARALVGSPPPRPTGEEVVESMPAFMPDRNPLDTDAGFAARQVAGCKLLDEDCYGFLLVSVHRPDSGVRGRIELECEIEPQWWPAMAKTLERVLDEVQ